MAVSPTFTESILLKHCETNSQKSKEVDDMDTDKNKLVDFGTEECNVRVIVRVRPFIEREIRNGAASKCIRMNEADHSISIGIMERKLKEMSLSHKQFTFDKIFNEQATQTQIFENGPKQIIDKTLQGFNGCIFCYGQTGSGKTFTMFGDDEHRGIIYKANAYIQNYIQENEEDKVYALRATFIEIYNERIADLLVEDPNSKKNEKLSIRRDPIHGVYVDNAIQTNINSEDDLREVLEHGQKRRQVAATKMNEQSSRSHSILGIHLDIKQNENDVVPIKSSLYFVDLAGSERAGKHAGNDSKLLREGTNINLSLTSLGLVIKALVEKSKHIPYRNSMLTRLLQDSLGGDSLTIMIANLGPSSSDSAESLSTLRFANRAKEIKNKANKYRDPIVAEMARLRLENKKLLSENKKLKFEIQQMIKMGRGRIKRLGMMFKRKLNAGSDGRCIIM